MGKIGNTISTSLTARIDQKREPTMTPDSPKTKFPTRGGLSEVEAYFANLDPIARPALESLRQTIREAAPEATEVLSYGMPAFTHHGQRFVYYAAWKAHCSVYGLVDVLDQFKREVAAYRTPKGMLKFALDEPLPTKLLLELIRARLGELQQE